MNRGEFELIESFFKDQFVCRDDVLLGIGDDAAILQVPQGMQLAVTTDSLVAGTHFLADADPSLIAHKALVSNISDLAAMGAMPAWCSLAITLPSIDSHWLTAFCQSFFTLAKKYQIALIGGDTTKGPLSISITLHGFVENNKALKRSGAKSGDGIFVTGSLGDCQAGLDLILQRIEQASLSDFQKRLIERHYKKLPRIEIGQRLKDLASSCLDISDGLCADLKHILKASQVGAKIFADKLPLSQDLLTYTKDPMLAAQIALISGEEYELCFSAPQKNHHQIQNLAKQTNIAISYIGQIDDSQKLHLYWQDRQVDWSQIGWDHFAKNNVKGNVDNE